MFFSFACNHRKCLILENTLKYVKNRVVILKASHQDQDCLSHILAAHVTRGSSLYLCKKVSNQSRCMSYRSRAAIVMYVQALYKENSITNQRTIISSVKSRAIK